MKVRSAKSIQFYVRYAYVLFLFTTFFVGGCASHKETIDIDRLAAPAEVMAMVNSSSNSLQTFSAEGSLTIDSPRLSQSVGFQLDVKKPDSMRIILEGPFGITVGQALITKEHFIAYNALQNSVYEGKTSFGFGMMQGIDISPDVIVDAATGIRRFDDSTIQPDSFYIFQNNYILKFFDSTEWKVYTVNGSSRRITQVETYNKNSNMLTRREVYKYIHNTNGTWEPTTAAIFLPEKKTHVEISFSTVAFNLPLQDLNIAYPDDVERITIQ